MNILRNLGQFLGIKQDPPLTEIEIQLLSHLKFNRNLAIQSIPDDMKGEFIAYIFSDKGLQKAVKEIFRNPFVTNKNRGEYARMLISSYIGIKGFGVRLILHHMIDPDDIYKKMLRDINLDIDN